MKNLGIKKLSTSDYRPPTNRLTEQSNTTAKSYLTIFLDIWNIFPDFELIRGILI